MGRLQLHGFIAVVAALVASLWFAAVAFAGTSVGPWP
jgi:hypothetical protein